MSDSTPRDGDGCYDFHRTLNQLRLNALLCDVTIVDDLGQKVFAHSVVLAAASEVLQGVLILRQSKNLLRRQGLTFKISGITAQVWDLILEFLYLRRLQVSLGVYVLKELYRAARVLRITQLVRSLDNIMSDMDLQVDEDAENINMTLAPSRNAGVKDKAVQVEVIDEPPRDNRGENVVNVRAKREPSTGLVHVIVEREGAQQATGADNPATDFPSESSHKAGTPCRFCKQRFDGRCALVEHLQRYCKRLSYVKTKDVTGNGETRDSQDGEGNDEGDGQTVIKSSKTKLKEKLECMNMKCRTAYGSYAELKKHERLCLMADTSFNVCDYAVTDDNGVVVYVANSGDGGGGGGEGVEGVTETPRAKLLSSGLHKGSKPMYQCCHCDFKANYGKIATHLAVVHGKCRPHHCKECELQYGYFESLRDHYWAQHTSLTLTCSECSQVFTKREKLRRHVLMVHKRRGQLTHVCHGCGKKFLYASHARRHETYHRPADERRTFTCPLCGKCFLTKQDLFRHKQTHTETKRYKCSRCSYTALRNFNVLIHERKHGIIHGNFICLTCDRYFLSQQRFQHHLDSANHEGTSVENMMRPPAGSDTVKVIPENDTVNVKPENDIVKVTPENHMVKVTPDSDMVKVTPENNVVKGAPKSAIVKVIPEIDIANAKPEIYTLKAVPEGYTVASVPDGYTVESVSDGCTMESVPEGYTVEWVPESDSTKAAPDSHTVQAVKTNPSFDLPTDTEIVQILDGRSGMDNSVIEQILAQSNFLQDDGTTVITIVEASGSAQRPVV